MADNKQIAADVLEAVGGKSNVAFVTHCMTRLRFNLKDRTIPKVDEVKKIKGVLGAQESGGQFQVIIGQNVPKVYSELCALGGFAEQDAIQENLDPALANEPLTPKLVGQKILSYLTGSVTPLIPILMCAGIFKVVAALFGPSMLGLITAEDDLTVLMNMVYNAVFYFVPIYLGFNAAKQLGATPFLGALAGAILIEPNFMAMASAGESFSVFGIPCTPATYSQTVMPILLTIPFLALFEKIFKKYLPEALSTVFVPVLTIALTLPVSLCFCAPMGSWISNGLAAVLNFLANQGGVVSILAGGILGGLWSLIVTTGMHLPVIMLALPAYLEAGSDSYILVATGVRMWAVFATCIACWLRLRDPEEKQRAFGYMIAQIVGGVGEPFIFGMMFRYKRLWLTSAAGAFVASTMGLILHVTYYVQSSSNFLSILSYAGGSTDNFVKAVIAASCGAAVAFVLTYLFGFSKKELEGEID